MDKCTENHCQTGHTGEHMTQSPGNSKYVKKLNRMMVLNIIKEHEQISRQQIASLTGLTPPTITGIIRELISQGFVKEVGLGRSEGGRRPMYLNFNSNAGYVAGVEVTRQEVIIGASDLKNHPANIQVIKLNMTEPANGIRYLSETIKTVIAQEQRNGKVFLGVGIAFPGLLNVQNGSVQRSINLGPAWGNIPLRQILSQALGLPVFMENNSNACVLAEQWFGGGTACKDLVYINLGEGISAGIILADMIIQGFQGHAGEIGHMVIEENGPLCNCGNRGCLEALCGIPRLLSLAEAALDANIDLDTLLKSANQPGSVAWQLLQQFGHRVGLAVANVINLYNPEVVFLGGKLATVGNVFLPVLQQTVNSHAFPEVAKSAKITISALGSNAGVIGACALALRGILQTDDSSILNDSPASFD
jgi:predicted NBD/HSP70 family sugar kinase